MWINSFLRQKREGNGDDEETTTSVQDDENTKNKTHHDDDGNVEQMNEWGKRDENHLWF